LESDTALPGKAVCTVFLMQRWKN